MFSLAIYDTLTPGSLTGDRSIAGTGTMDESGMVGPIGGIHAEDRGRPRRRRASCSSCRPTTATRPSSAHNGDMRLVKAVTMHAAVQAIETWVKNPDAKLPTCRDDRRAEGRRMTASSGPIPSSTTAIEGVDPALAAAVLEIENHIATGGWDQPARLYALVPTAELVEKEPFLAHAMGLDEAAEQGSFTPVEQEAIGADADLERTLATIAWPPGVAGCAAVVERLVLPPAADASVLETRTSAAAYARRAPRPPGRAHRRGRHARRGDVLRTAAACRRRRHVRADRCRPGAGPARAAARDAGGPTTPRIARGEDVR